MKTMTVNKALKVQDKAVSAVISAWERHLYMSGYPLPEFMNSDFDGEVLSLWFSVKIRPEILTAVKKALPDMKVTKCKDLFRKAGTKINISKA